MAGRGRAKELDRGVGEAALEGGLIYPSAPVKPASIEMSVTSPFRRHILLFGCTASAKKYLECLFTSVPLTKETTMTDGFVTVECEVLPQVTRCIYTPTQRAASITPHEQQQIKLIRMSEAQWRAHDAGWESLAKKKPKKRSED